MLSYMKYIWNGQLNGPLPFLEKTSWKEGGGGGGGSLFNWLFCTIWSQIVWLTSVVYDWLMIALNTIDQS